MLRVLYAGHGTSEIVQMERKQEGCHFLDTQENQITV